MASHCPLVVTGEYSSASAERCWGEWSSFSTQILLYPERLQTMQQPGAIFKASWENKAGHRGEHSVWARLLVHELDQAKRGDKSEACGTWAEAGGLEIPSTSIWVALAQGQSQVEIPPDAHLRFVQ